MKILIITQYYYPEQFQINEIAPDLVRRGHSVTVVCGLPNYPKGVIYEGYDNENDRRRIEERYRKETGVEIIHCRQNPRGKSILQIIKNYWSFAKESKKVIRTLTRDYDVVLGYQLSPVTSMLAALDYKKIYKKPVLFYTLDLWPVSAESMLHGKKNPMYLWVKYISKKIYSKADRILVTSRPFIDYLNSKIHIPMERLAYLPQHAGTEMLGMDLRAEDNSVADFMFAGNIGKGQRVDIIIKAATILGVRNDYKIHIVGDGSMRSELEQLVKEKGLTANVIFYGNQKREAMPKYYKMADALLITLRGNNAVGDTMPGKLQMYMTTGKPILGAINGAAAEVIDEAKCGICVKAGDYEGLARLMKRFIDNPQEYQSCGENARQFFKNHFTLEHYMDGLEAELHQLIINN